MVSTSKRYLKSKWKKFYIYAQKAREFRKYRYVKIIKPCRSHHINILVDKPASLFPCGCTYKYNPNKCKPLMQFWVKQAKLIFKKSNSLLPLLQNHEGVQIHFHTKFSQLSSSVPFPHTLMLFYIPWETLPLPQLKIPFLYISTLLCRFSCLLDGPPLFFPLCVP